MSSSLQGEQTSIQVRNCNADEAPQSSTSGEDDLSPFSELAGVVLCLSFQEGKSDICLHIIIDIVNCKSSVLILCYPCGCTEGRGGTIQGWVCIAVKGASQRSGVDRVE